MLRVFIVEDMAIIAISLQDTLEDLGHEVVGVAGSVDTAIKAIAAMQPLPEAVILDADLRGSSSRPVAEALRKLHIPFMVASGYGDEKLRDIIVDEPTLPKPLDRRRLQQTLDGLTSRA